MSARRNPPRHPTLHSLEGERLRRLLAADKAGVTIGDLSLRFGVSTSTIQRALIMARAADPQRTSP